MKVFLRHLVLCALPIVFAAGAGYGFGLIKGSCTAMVGPLFAGKCHGVQQEYQVKFELAGGAFGILVGAGVGTWLEHRRRRAVQPATSTGVPS